MAILVVFWGFIGLFGLKIGLPIDIDLNEGKNKNEVHMY